MKIMKTNDKLEPAVFAIFAGAGDWTWRRIEQEMIIM